MQHNERTHLEAIAWWYLQRAEQIPPAMGEKQLPRLRVWAENVSFRCDTNPTSWTVFPRYQEGASAPFVREAVWEYWNDQQNQATTPTLRVRAAPVPADEFERLMAEAWLFKVPVVWEPPHRALCATDASYDGFEVLSSDAPPARQRFEWAAGKPEHWKPLVAWFSKMRQFLMGCLNA